jgi:flavin-dependent dehydrogenase
LLALPTDGGLYQVLVWLGLSELDRFRRDPEACFMDHVHSSDAIARVVAGARRVGKFVGSARWTGFFREAAGPGWVLAGDAGHFKDPAPGRGIGDAFLQADALAPAVVSGLDGSGEGIDASMARWGRWRDREFAEHYWFATDLGKAGAVPAVLPVIVRDLQEHGRTDLFLDVLSHRVKPSRVLTPPRLMKATGRLLARRGADRAAVLREVGSLAAEDARRRWWNRRPVYEEPSDAGRDARATEVDDTATVAGAAASGRGR